MVKSDLLISEGTFKLLSYRWWELEAVINANEVRLLSNFDWLRIKALWLMDSRLKRSFSSYYVDYVFENLQYSMAKLTFQMGY